MMKKIVFIFALVATCSFFANAAEIIRPQLVCGGEAKSFFSQIYYSNLKTLNNKPIEAAAVKADCDKDNLYLTFDMEDNDIITEATENQTKLGGFGDAVQIFLKSEKETFLWEFFVSCNGKKSCFFHIGAGRMSYPQADSPFPDFKVENKLSKGRWIAEVTIPLSIFREKGFKFTNDEKWTFMLIRHNDSRFHSERDNACYPQSGGSSSDPAYFGELVLK